MKDNFDSLNFVPIPNMDGYFINALGVVITEYGTVDGNNRCPYFTLQINGKAHAIHIIVAKLFVPNPDNKPFVNHKNGIKLDPYYKNLEWVTSRENTTHMVTAGLSKSKWPVAPYLAAASVGDVIKIPHNRIGNIKHYIHYSPFKFSIIGKGIDYTMVKRLK